MNVMIHKHQIGKFRVPVRVQSFHPETIGVQDGVPVVWGTHDESDGTIGTFNIVFTGMEFDNEQWEMKDSIFDPHTGLAWHLLVARNRIGVGCS